MDTLTQESALVRRGVSRAVAELMAANCMSGNALAIAAGLDPKTVNNLVHDRFPPNLDTLTRCASALGVPVARLFEVADGNGSSYIGMADGNRKEA